MTISLNLSVQTLSQQADRLCKNTRVKIVTAALFTRSVKEVAKDPNIRLDTYFSHTLSQKIDPFDQHKTGTCWLQAGLTLMCIIAKSRNITFKPSITHLLFYDKLEKASVFLYRFLNDDMDDRTKTFLLSQPIDDGGTWSMFHHLVSKYGIVPEDTYPETFQAKNTAYLNMILNTYLRKASQDEQLVNTIHEHIQKIHEILLTCMSRPPESIELFVKKHGLNFKGNPTALFASLQLPVTNYVSLMHAPNKKFEKYTAFPSNNYEHMQQHTFIVTSLDSLKRVCVKCIQDDMPVWFTANVSGSADFERNVLECNAINYNMLFDTNLTRSKVERMNCRDIAPNHAMLLIGVHCEGKTPMRWKVQNSWGKDKAFLSMSNEWFEQNVFEISVPLKYYEVPKHLKINSLPPWDILSTVAHHAH